MEEVHQPSKLWYYSPKGNPPQQQVLVSYPEEIVAASDSSSLHRNVTVRKNKRKRKSYAEMLKKIYRKEKETSNKPLLLSTRKMMTNRKT